MNISIFVWVAVSCRVGSVGGLLFRTQSKQRARASRGQRKARHISDNSQISKGRGMWGLAHNILESTDIHSLRGTRSKIPMPGGRRGKERAL